AETVGVESVGRRRRTGGRSGGGSGSRGTAGTGRSDRGSATGQTGIDALDGVLKVDELLIELADAGFDFLEIVGEALDLCGHGVEARAGIGLDVLHGFLERTHGAV